MARSSTTFSGKWRSGKTTVVRIPEKLADRVLDYARDLDEHKPATTAAVKELALKESNRPALSSPNRPENRYRTAADVDLERPVNVASVPQLSPFRYPGGKTWLVPYARTWLASLQPRTGLLIEPFAGGGITGLTAAFERLAEHVILVERDPDVASVWRAILGGQAEWLAERIERFELTKANVVEMLGTPAETQRERAFATILRNRVQRGGIMAAGAGLVKNGENGRGLRSRWYPKTLAARIRAIAALRQRFTFIEGDGFEIIEAYSDQENASFFVDPPYTIAARRLYSHWQVEHEKLFEMLRQVRGSVLLTYDKTAEIATLAQKFGFETRSIAMKNTHHARMSELLVGKELSWLRGARASAGLNPQTAPAKPGSHP